MKVKNIVFLICGIAFSTVATVMFCFFILPGIQDKDILKNGKEAIATVIDVGSNTTYNDEEYYYIKFTFVNDQGQTITYKTNSAYTIWDLEDMGHVTIDMHSYTFTPISGTTIEIKYVGNKAVAKDYIEEPQGIVQWVMVIVFGLVGVGMMVAFVVSIVNSKGNKKILQHGMDGTGTFLQHSVGMIVNGVRHFKIHFSFVNQMGETVIAKTGTNYLSYEVDALMTMHTFPIRYIGNKAVINLSKQELLSGQHSY